MVGQLDRKLLWIVALSVVIAGCQQSTVTTPGTQATPIVYYYFASTQANTLPAGSVVILPSTLILSPTLSSQSRSSDTKSNIQTALQSMINDHRNIWKGSNLTITSISFNSGEANVVLSGDISGTGDIVLVAAETQFLMTIFAEPSVQTAIVTLNGQTIGNLGISHSSEAKPADYKYTRSEIEIFMKQNAYHP